MQEHEAECLHHFNSMDVDKDNVLSIEDLKAVIDYMVDEKGVDANEVRTFAHDLSDADYNDDGQIDKQEFMIACEGQNYAGKKDQLKSALKENTWEKAKKDLAIKRAQHQGKAKSRIDFKLIGQKVKGIQLAHFAQEGECGDMVDQFLSVVDTNGDGLVSYEEELELLLSEGFTEAESEVFLESRGVTPGDLQTRADLIASCEEWSTNEAPSEQVVFLKKVVKKAAKKTEINKEAALKECAGFFERMDIDQDGELSLQDLETIVDTKIKNNVDDSKLREFVDSMADLDLNNDEIIDNVEFMSACLND